MKATPSQKRRIPELLMKYPICYQPKGTRNLVFCDPLNRTVGRLLGPTGKARPIGFEPNSFIVKWLS